MPKEETFRVPLKYIDVTKSTFSDLDVMQLLECRFMQTFVRFLERFHEVHSTEKKITRDTCGPEKD